MNLSYNGVSTSDMVTFTDVPNILKVSEEMSGNKAEIIFTFNGDLIATVSADSQYYITLFGETISNVMNPSDAKNKRFYISAHEEGTAMSVARALRNCGGIAADFNIIHDNEMVILQAKTIGRKFLVPNYLQRNIQLSYMTVQTTDGSANSILWNSKLNLDIYSGAAEFIYENYVTTLEKNYYGNECAFDVSQVLSTFSEYGKTIPYRLQLSLLTENGDYQNVGYASGNTTVGYLANQSEKYLLGRGVQPLMNLNRGQNGILLYSYSPTVEYSVLCGFDTGGWTTTVSCKDSAFNELYSYSQTYRRTDSNMIIDCFFTVPTYIFPSTFYIDITIGSNDPIRFEVIKPLKATEYYQRITWRNEYGGISLFDFTGPRSESDNVENTTYEKNVFDYYETEAYERKKIYDTDYKKTVSLTSHLLKEDGKWIFNSLMKSKSVWTEVNGKKFFIIPTTIEVVEDSTYNNIYTATLNYEYSDIG